jgi:hypothetical protein
MCQIDVLNLDTTAKGEVVPASRPKAGSVSDPWRVNF